jgi:hypothetical protein
MLTLKKTTAIIMMACQLAACASPENRAALQQYKGSCAAGDAQACRMIPYQESVNQNQALENTGKGVAIAVLLPVLILAAMADAKLAASCRPRWAC